MNKKTLMTVIALVVLVAALVGVYFLTRPETTAGMKEFTLEVVHKDGTVKTIPCKSDLNYVGEALQKEGLIAGEQGPYGLYIHEVDGEKAIFEVDGAYWAFYEGEEYATKGIDLTPIVDGKVYKLVYTINGQT